MIIEQRTCGTALRPTMDRRTTGVRVAGALSVMLAMLMLVSGGAGAQLTGSPQALFKICDNQQYALCATTSCLVFDQVAYCKCDVEYGKSISLNYRFANQNVCSVNAEGADNGYMVSTYSLPASVVVGGNQALYTCRGSTSDGAYAQCDGGICFSSTRVSRFPASRSRCRTTRSSVRARSPSRIAASRSAIRSSAHIPARTPSTRIATGPAPIRIRGAPSPSGRRPACRGS